jgi:hypothetical protein
MTSHASSVQQLCRTGRCIPPELRAVLALLVCYTTLARPACKLQVLQSLGLLLQK